MSNQIDNISLWVHRDTGFIYQAQLFDKFVLVRLAAQGTAGPVMKVDFVDFSREFQEMSSELEAAREWLDGGNPDLINLEM